MSQAEKAMYLQLLDEQNGTEQGRPLQERSHEGGPHEQQGEWESGTIPASRACVSVPVSPVGEEENEDSHLKPGQEQWAGHTLGGPRVGSPCSGSTQGHCNSSHSSCVALPLAPGSGPSVTFCPTRGARSSIGRGGCSNGRWATPNGGPHGSHRRAFVEPGPPEGDGRSESDWSGAERQEERHSRIASRRRTGPQQLSQEQIDEMNLLFARKCSLLLCAASLSFFSLHVYASL